MNKLAYHRFYLCGPMDDDREGGRKWRTEMGEWLIQRKIIPIDPYNKPIEDVKGLEDDQNFIERIDAINRFDYSGLTAAMKDIRTTDLRFVDIADAVIVNLDLSKIICGTYEELFWANRQKKPIILHCPQGKHNVPHWMFATIPHEMMFSSFDEVKEYIDGIDSGRNTNYLKRWVIINYGDVLNVLDRKLDKQQSSDC